MNFSPPIIVGVLVLVIWAAINAGVLFLAPPMLNETVTARILGTTDALALLFGNWLWGSSRSSQAKDATIADLKKETPSA